MRCSAPTYHDDLLTNRRVVLQSPATTTLYISTLRRKLSVDFELDPTRFTHTPRAGPHVCSNRVIVEDSMIKRYSDGEVTQTGLRLQT